MAQEFTSYSVDADNRFKAALAKAKESIADLTIPLIEISKDFYKSEQAIFKLKGPGQYPDLGGFNPDEIAPGSTKSRREIAKDQKQKQVGFIYPILKREGRLADSLLNPSHSDAINQIVNKSNLIIGTKVPYAVYHQSDAPRSIIPLRKFLFIGPEAIQFARDPVLSGRLQRWTGILEEFVKVNAETFGEVK